VFYAPFLELMVALSRSQVDRAVQAYEEFVAAYAWALRDVPHGSSESARRATGSPISTSARAGSTRPRRCSSAGTTRIAATSRSRCREPGVPGRGLDQPRRALALGSARCAQQRSDATSWPRGCAPKQERVRERLS